MPESRGAVYLDTAYATKRYKGVGIAASVLRIQAACWCAENKTYREFPRRGLEDLNELRGPNPPYSQRHIGQLVRAGLWEPTKEGWLIIDPELVIDPDGKFVAPDFEDGNDSNG